MHITLIAGARPNFMKIAPIIDALEKRREMGHNIDYRLVHTGQHYDKNMSENFFLQLGIPSPHANLESGGGSQAASGRGGHPLRTALVQAVAAGAADAPAGGGLRSGCAIQRDSVWRPALRLRWHSYRV